jgi:Tfp pilus assembly PilM family ATPase
VLHSFAKWWSGRPVWLGLSVNAQGMTLVEWSAAARAQPSALRWGQASWTAVASDPAVTDPWQDPSRLGVAVQELAQRTGVRCRRLAMGVSAERVVQQRLQVEANWPVSELRAQVQWNASQALGLAWDEVAFDYRFDPQDDGLSPQADGLRTLHWLACPLALVLAAQQMCRSARLRLQFMGVEPAQIGGPELTFAGMPEGPVQLQLACEMARQGAQS